MSPERQAIDKLLAQFPDHDIEWIGSPRLELAPGQWRTVGEDSPWLSIQFKHHPIIHLWKNTGSCYYEDAEGAVLDDPFLTVNG